MVGGYLDSSALKIRSRYARSCLFCFAVRHCPACFLQRRSSPGRNDKEGQPCQRPIDRRCQTRRSGQGWCDGLRQAGTVGALCRRDADRRSGATPVERTLGRIRLQQQVPSPYRLQGVRSGRCGLDHKKISASHSLNQTVRQRRFARRALAAGHLGSSGPASNPIARVPKLQEGGLP